jgi:hypothetical protein
MVGIAQGCPYSPLALNVRLHHAHDLGMAKAGFPLWLRYADNLTYGCGSVSEGNQIRERAAEMLAKAGFSLKGEDGPPADLRAGQTVELLGFKLKYQRERLVLELGPQAWNHLNQNLVKAHETTNPSEMAFQVIQGWMSAYGPAFENRRDEVSVRVLENAARYGFREIAFPEDVQRRLKKSYGKWLQAYQGHKKEALA